LNAGSWLSLFSFLLDVHNVKVNEDILQFLYEMIEFFHQANHESFLVVFVYLQTKFQSKNINSIEQSFLRKSCEKYQRTFYRASALKNY